MHEKMAGCHRMQGVNNTPEVLTIIEGGEGSRTASVLNVGSEITGINANPSEADTKTITEEREASMKLRKDKFLKKSKIGSQR